MPQRRDLSSTRPALCWMLYTLKSLLLAALTSSLNVGIFEINVSVSGTASVQTSTASLPSTPIRPTLPKSSAPPISTPRTESRSPANAYCFKFDEISAGFGFEEVVRIKKKKKSCYLQIDPLQNSILSCVTISQATHCSADDSESLREQYCSTVFRVRRYTAGSRQYLVVQQNHTGMPIARTLPASNYSFCSPSGPDVNMYAWWISAERRSPNGSSRGLYFTDRNTQHHLQLPRGRTLTKWTVLPSTSDARASSIFRTFSWQLCKA